METIPDKKGYKIQNIYYSDNDGNIIKTTLNSLKNEEHHYSRFYRQNKNIIWYTSLNFIIVFFFLFNGH